MSETAPSPPKERTKRRRPRRRQRDLIAAIASGFVGALALAASMYNVYLQRVQIRAQVWPHLEWTYSDVDGFSYELENTGVGPAIVKGVGATVDGKTVKSWREAFDVLRSSDRAFAALFDQKNLKSVHSMFSARVLGANVAVHPYAFSNISQEDVAVIEAADARLHFRICYCSTLDECWMLERDVGTTPIASCRSEALTFNE